MATIYICGDTTSLNDEKAFIDMKKLKSKLKAMKYAVIMPDDMGFSQMRWSDALEHRIKLLKKSQAVYVLPNWKDNVMSRIELTVAMDIKLETFFHPVSNKELKQLITTLDG